MSDSTGPCSLDLGHEIWLQAHTASTALCQFQQEAAQCLRWKNPRRAEPKPDTTSRFLIGRTFAASEPLSLARKEPTERQQFLTASGHLNRLETHGGLQNLVGHLFMNFLFEPPWHPLRCGFVTGRDASQAVFSLKREGAVDRMETAIAQLHMSTAFEHAPTE